MARHRYWFNNTTPNCDFIPQNCMAPLTKEDNFNAVNQDELRTNAETSGQRFLDLARQMEAFFLQKRYLLSIQKPELILMEVRAGKSLLISTW